MLKLQVQHNSISRQMFKRIWFYSREAFEVASNSCFVCPRRVSYRILFQCRHSFKHLWGIFIVLWISVIVSSTLTFCVQMLDRAIHLASFFPRVVASWDYDLITDNSTATSNAVSNGVILIRKTDDAICIIFSSRTSSSSFVVTAIGCEIDWSCN